MRFPPLAAPRPTYLEFSILSILITILERLINGYRGEHQEEGRGIKQG